MDKEFAMEVKSGLGTTPKSLSSKYFYDVIGDALFVKIMHCGEYYLTRAELEIFTKQANAILSAVAIGEKPLDIIELGAGDGTKTLELLKKLDLNQVTYRPVDISGNALEKLQYRIQNELPHLRVYPLRAEYFTALKSLQGKQTKLILFLGSNLGNMPDDRAHQFMLELSNSLQEGDMVLMGLDLIKSANIVLPAYNDAQGYTRDFNLNLLRRINHELGGDFDLTGWKHVPSYSEEEGIARSHLESLHHQEVYIQAIDQRIQFSKGECIKTEISRKYNDQVIEEVLAKTSFAIIDRFFDSNHYFTDLLLKKI